MKRTTMLLAGCLAIGVGGNAAMAQNDSAKPRIGAETDVQKLGQEQKQAHEKAPQAGDLAHANRMLDKTLRNPQGKQIGEVEDMIIDSQGRVAFVIVSFEDDFVAGDKLHAVPPQALRPGSDPAGQDLILSTTKDKFTAASGFTEDQYPQFDEQSIRDTYRRFDQTPYWDGRMEDRHSDRSNRTDSRLQFQRRTADRDNDARDNRDDVRNNVRDNRDNRTAAQRADQDANRDRTAAQRADQDANRDRTAAQRVDQDANRDRIAAMGQRSHEDRRGELNQVPQFDLQHGWTSRASEIIGKNVVNNSNESLGNVQDLLVDVRQHRVVYAVLSDGGVLGIDETLTPIPYSALKAAGEKEQFALDATKDSFTAFSFEEGAWPDLTNSQWVQRVHTQFKQDPYWAVYGYASTDTNDVDKHWRHDSEYNKSFDAQRSTTARGTVISVSEFSPDNNAAKGRQIMLRSEDGKTHTVHMGPSSYMERQNSNFAIKQGDEVMITGSTAKFQGKDVLIASQIRNKDGKTLELRDSDGRPKWDSQDRDNRLDNQSRINDRGNDRVDSNRIQPTPNQPNR